MPRLEEIIPGINLGNVSTDFPDPETNYLQVNLNHHLKYDRIDKETKELFDSFKDQVVIDLFSGPFLDVYREACRARAIGYVAIDLFSEFTEVNCLGKSDNYNKSRVDEYNIERHIPAFFKGEDSLMFLKRLPSNSVSIHISGAGFCFFNNYDYKRAVEKEIERVLHSSGAYIGHATEIVPSKLKLAGGKLGFLDVFKLSKD